MSFGILPIEDMKSCGASADKSADQNVENVPSGDLVSRQLLIGAIEKCGEEKIYPQALIQTIKALPSAETHGVCSDLISRAELRKAFCKINDLRTLSLGKVGGIIDSVPSADRPKVNSDSAEEQIAETEQKLNRPKGGPETEPAPVVAYICDRRRCAICSGPDGGCDHTTDIKHAAHFKNVAGQYFERPYMEEEDDGKDNDQG